VDCGSAPCGLTASVESEIGGFFGVSTVCGRCTLRAGLFFFFAALACFLDGLLASPFGVFSAGIRAASCKSAGPRPPRKFPLSNHRDMASFRSSIAPHPARPKLADTAIETSATRVQARIDTLMSRRDRVTLINHSKRSITEGSWSGVSNRRQVIYVAKGRSTRDRIAAATALAVVAANPAQSV
jgi:hypothetical protein